MKSLGMHYLAEFHHCPYEIINDTVCVEEIMNRAAEKSRATIIKSLFHKFSPHGVSGIIVVAESHFAIHTWPEHGYASVDLFSCGEFDYMSALEHIRHELKAASHTYSAIERGRVPGDSGVTGPLKIRTIPLEEN
jgi:S-adenosylmethionine decarboxylase proenzyme